MQHGREHGALDRELEAAAGQKVGDHGVAAGLFPQPPEQQGRTDALAGQALRIAGLELRQNDGTFGVTADRHGEAFELARGNDGFLAAEIFDDALLGAAILADALDEIEVGVTSDVLFADEHARLAARRIRECQSQSPLRPHYLAPQICAVSASPQCNQWLMQAQPSKSARHCSS